MDWCKMLFAFSTKTVAKQGSYNEVLCRALGREIFPYIPIAICIRHPSAPNRIGCGVDNHSFATLHIHKSTACCCWRISCGRHHTSSSLGESLYDGTIQHDTQHQLFLCWQHC